MGKIYMIILIREPSHIHISSIIYKGNGHMHGFDLLITSKKIASFISYKKCPFKTCLPCTVQIIKADKLDFGMIYKPVDACQSQWALDWVSCRLQFPACPPRNQLAMPFLEIVCMPLDQSNPIPPVISPSHVYSVNAFVKQHLQEILLHYQEKMINRI